MDDKLCRELNYQSILSFKVCYGKECQGIFSSSRDKTVNMWKCGVSNPVRQFIGHDLVVTALAINRGE